MCHLEIYTLFSVCSRMPLFLIIITPHRSRVLQIPSRLSGVIYYKMGYCLAHQGAGKCRFPDRPGVQQHTAKDNISFCSSFLRVLLRLGVEIIMNRTPRKKHFLGDVVKPMEKNWIVVNHAKENFFLIDPIGAAGF